MLVIEKLCWIEKIIDFFLLYLILSEAPSVNVSITTPQLRFERHTQILSKYVCGVSGIIADSECYKLLSATFLPNLTSCQKSTYPSLFSSLCAHGSLSYLSCAVLTLAAA